MYYYGNAGVEWKLLPFFLIILNCIGKGVLILAKLPQHRFQYNIILNVLSDHVIVIHHSLDRISLTVNNMPPICSQDDDEELKKQNSKEKKKKQSIFSITEDSIEKYWKCELKTNAI